MKLRKIPRPARSHPGLGMTLLELLVVIVIIGILAGLILPALGRAKDQAARIGCVNNLRQVHLGFSLYLGDHAGVFPAPGSRDGERKTAACGLWLVGKTTLTNCCAKMARGEAREA
jgi:prepilin-type N-terminal cleavage/methylation domain-containing protein